jgi:hypothetical protein
MKALWSVVFSLMFASCAFAQSPITAGTTTADKNGKSFFVFFPLVNSGTASLDKVTVTAVVLGSALKPTGIKLPFSVGNLAAGAFGGITLLFPDRTLVTGQSYQITAQGTFLENGALQTFQVGTTVTYSSSSIFDKPANPLTVAPALDAKHAVTQLMSAAKGGTLTTTGADGSVFTLTFPANALASDEQITMTPLTSVAGLPVSGGLLAGVDLQPDGLRLTQAATLSIQPVISVACSQQIGFGYHATGQEFYFQPLGLSKAITLSLEHFSAAGVGQGQAGSGGVPTDNEDRLSQVNQPILLQQRQCGPEAPLDTQQLIQQMAGNLQLYYDKVVVPLLQAAKTDDTQAENALGKALSFDHDVTVLGLDSEEPFSLDIKYIFQSMPIILKNVYNKAFSRCINENSNTARMEDGSKMIAVARDFALIGDAIGKELPNFNQQVSACLVGPLALTMDSSATGVLISPSQTTTATSHVTAQSLPLVFNESQLSYSGSGPLAYDSYTVSVQWPPPFIGDCSSGFGNPGTLSVTATFDLNAGFPGNANQVRLKLVVTPNINETTTFGVVLPDGTCQSGTSTTQLYESDLAATHLDKQLTLAYPYYVNVNTPATYNLAGTLQYQNQSYAGTETTTLTAAQTQ